MKPYLIGIAGPSGAGKTCLATHIAERLAAPIVSLDHYYRELDNLTYEQRCRVNFDDPEALDFHLIVAQMTTLAAGQAIDCPIYDFATHSRKAETERIEPHEFIIIEGLFVLYWDALRALLGTKIFVELDDEVCFLRRLDRDVRERGRTPESVREQYAQTVRPMAVRYVRPTRQFADLVIAGDATLETSADLVLEHVRQTRRKLGQSSGR